LAFVLLQLINGFIISLSQENIRKYSKYFWNIENFIDREVLLSYWKNFKEDINLMLSGGTEIL